MPSDLHFRLAMCADASHVIAVDHIAVESENRRQFIRKSIASDSCYVAEWDHRIARYGVLENSFFEHGFISMLYIAPTARRQGIGSALMRHMEQICTTPKLFTSANESNAAMRALLEKLGYRRSGYIENLDTGDPELIYFKQLGGRRDGG